MLIFIIDFNKPNQRFNFITLLIILLFHSHNIPNCKIYAKQFRDTILENANGYIYIIYKLYINYT